MDHNHNSQVKTSQVKWSQVRPIVKYALSQLVLAWSLLPDGSGTVRWVGGVTCNTGGFVGEAGVLNVQKGDMTVYDVKMSLKMTQKECDNFKESCKT